MMTIEVGFFWFYLIIAFSEFQEDVGREILRMRQGTLFVYSYRFCVIIHVKIYLVLFD